MTNVIETQNPTSWIPVSEAKCIEYFHDSTFKSICAERVYNMQIQDPLVVKRYGQGFINDGGFKKAILACPGSEASYEYWKEFNKNHVAY